MDETLLWSGFAVLWMGVLGTISPCPLASNVAAVSIITGGGGGKPQGALVTALSYGAGRMFVHFILGAILLKGLVSAPTLAVHLQRAPAKLMGPVFMILGAFLLNWLEIKLPSGLKKKILQKRPSGAWGTFLVGCGFSLIPCPETAALFLGGMLPLALSEGASFLFPALFGLGTAIPVMILGIILSFGVSHLATHLGKIRSVESTMQNMTGYAFLLYGLFLTLDNVYSLF